MLVLVLENCPQYDMKDRTINPACTEALAVFMANVLFKHEAAQVPSFI